MKRFFSGVGLAFLAAVAFCQNAMADLVEIGAGGTMADVTVSPAELLVPLITIIGAIVTACGSLWLVVIGIKWLLKFVNK